MNTLKTVGIVVEMIGGSIGHNCATTLAILAELTVGTIFAEFSKRELAIIGKRCIVKPDIPQVAFPQVTLNQVVREREATFDLTVACDAAR